MKFDELYETYAQENEPAESAAVDEQITQFQEKLAAGKMNRAALLTLQEDLGAALQEDAGVNNILPIPAIRIARRYAALCQVLAIVPMTSAETIDQMKAVQHTTNSQPFEAQIRVGRNIRPFEFFAADSTAAASYADGINNREFDGKGKIIAVITL